MIDNKVYEKIALRNLVKEDANDMLSWIKDNKINCFYRFEANEMTLKDILSFIDASSDDRETMHRAIVDENNSYLGTISLKNINPKNKNAEFAIATMAKVHGKGVAGKALRLMMHIAFAELGLHKVYLDVFLDNKKAIRFYEKNGFMLEGELIDHVFVRGQYRSIRYYAMFEKEFMEYFHPNDLKPE